MKYSYGMRFDDDSNAVTVIDEDEQTAVTTGYVDGEYVEFSGGGSGSVTTETITGNIAEPFGDLDLEELALALDNAEVVVNIEIDASALGAGTIPAILGVGQSAFFTSGANILSNNVNQVNAYMISWSKADGVLSDARMLSGGNIVDLSTYANELTTTLTVVWYHISE